MTTLLLADDHQVVREGLKALLESEDDFSVVGEASDGLKVLPLVTLLKPDVLILDLNLPGLNGLEITRQICDRSLPTRVVILSMYADEGYVIEALKSGAMGYVLKCAGIGELMCAIRQVATGKRYLGAPLSQDALQHYLVNTTPQESNSYKSLTTREREILHLAAEGYSSSQVASKLGISSRTAETHRANLMRKLKVHSQTELVTYCIQRGVIRLDEDFTRSAQRPKPK